MISLYLLHFCGNYDEWERIGLDIINKAYVIGPSAPLVKLIYLRSTSSKSYNRNEYEQFLKLNSKELKQRIKGKGIIQSYIKDMRVIR